MADVKPHRPMDTITKAVDRLLEVVSRDPGGVAESEHGEGQGRGALHWPSFIR
jgi:hypothetical protein